MIANNIFRAIGDFCTEYAFAVYDMFRFTEGWWASNLVNLVIFFLGTVSFFYWLGEMLKHSKDPNAL